MDAKKGTGEGSEGSEDNGNEMFYCLGEYICCHEEHIIRNMNVKGASGEASERYKETKKIIGHWKEGDCYKEAEKLI